MIPADCMPKTDAERVIEIIDGPDRDGNCVFFLYWIGKGHFSGPRAQCFLANPKQHKADRVIDRRAWESRVQALEQEGLTRSDAQAVIDAEDARKK